MILTRNTAELRQVVERHVAAYAVIQSDCFDVIFCLNDIDEPVSALMLCLNHSNDPVSALKEYGLPAMVQRIADSIFERLPVEDALKFLAALPKAIGCDGKDLSRVPWQFLAQTLRNMPLQPAEIQAVVDPVIAGLELLAATSPPPPTPFAGPSSTAAAAPPLSRPPPPLSRPPSTTPLAGPSPPLSFAGAPSHCSVICCCSCSVMHQL